MDEPKAPVQPYYRGTEPSLLVEDVAMICHRYRAGKAALVGLVAGAAGALALSTPAGADIGVTPPQATQGDSARVTLRIPNERAPAYTTKVEVFLPESYPIAEVYPMSVPDWAPGLTMRQLAEPTALIHGTETTEVVSAVTWTLVANPAGNPVEASELSLSLGPLPATNRLVFSLRQTYSDGTVVQWGSAPGSDGVYWALPPPELALVPATAEDAAQGEAGGQTGAEAATGHDEPTEAATRGTGLGVALSVAMIIALVGAGAIVMYPRRRAAGAAEPEVAESDVAGPEVAEPEVPEPGQVVDSARR